jgi:hypothetical protein
MQNNIPDDNHRCPMCAVKWKQKCFTIEKEVQGFENLPCKCNFCGHEFLLKDVVMFTPIK